MTTDQIHAFADTFEAVAHLNGVAHAVELLTDIRDAFALDVSDVEIAELREGWLAATAVS